MKKIKGDEDWEYYEGGDDWDDWWKDINHSNWY